MNSPARTVCEGGRTQAALEPARSGLALDEAGTVSEGEAERVNPGTAPRVLLVVDSRFPGFGGAETQALKLALALREHGVDLEFLAPRVNASQPLEEYYHGVRVTRVVYPRVRWLGSLVLLANTIRRIVARRDDFDAVHVHVTHLMAAGAGYARRWSGLPVVTKVSGYYEFEGGVLDPRARHKPLNRLIRRGLARVDTFQTISEQTRTKLVEAGFREDQIAFVPNGIDTREPPPPRADDGVLRVGYCGRLREIKGVHVLLDAFAQVRAARPDAPLALSIAGDGETRDALEAQARALGLEDVLEWHGHIDETQTAPFYASLDIYVQPSFAEGLPNSVMEAMLYGRPVIVSDVGGNVDLVGDGETGLVFACGDDAALAAGLLRLVDDADLRRSLAAGGRDVIDSRYGFDAVVAQLLTLYGAKVPA